MDKKSKDASKFSVNRHPFKYSSEEKFAKRKFKQPRARWGSKR